MSRLIRNADGQYSLLEISPLELAKIQLGLVLSRQPELKLHAAECKHCKKLVRQSGRLGDREPAWATLPGLDPAADGHPWYCDAEGSTEHLHEPAALVTP
jgi:hypothetical protein